MAEWWEWSGEPGPLESNAGEAIDWSQLTSDDPGSWANQVSTDVANGGGGGSNFWSGLLSTLGSLGSSAMGSGGSGGTGSGGGGWLGPLLSALGSAGAGAVGAGASNEAAQLQSAALNRGLDLQTAQWLQQQANQAPWLQAGQEALQNMQGRSQWSGPQEPGVSAAVSGTNYTLPSTTPGWQPQNYTGPQAPQASDFTWTPQQGPRAQDFRYTPGQTTDATRYASQGPQLFQGAMPGTQVPTLSGQQLLDQDPGAAFRQTEARRQLEASAAARGGLLSGGTLQALQARSQDLASQEYQNAWQRMMTRDTEQYGRNWQQYQQNWNQGVQGTQLGLATNAQNFQQDLAATQLREQVNQVASQQGWTQAQAEAVFREQQAQLASQQGWTQALAGQQNQFTQGLQSAQWNQGQQQQWSQEEYARQLQQQQLRYGMDVTQNQTDYARQQQAYQQQVAEMTRQWNQFASMAGLGQTATNNLGLTGQANANQSSNLLSQLGTAQGVGAAGEGLNWMQAITSAANQGPSLLAGLNA